MIIEVNNYNEINYIAMREVTFMSLSESLPPFVLPTLIILSIDPST